MFQRASISPALVAVALGVLVAASAPLAARADDAVVYRMDVMGDEPVLLPRVVGVRGQTLLERARNLFGTLKKAKPQAYGRAALDISGDKARELERDKIATVSLDPDRPRTRREVLAEIVFTFNALGISSVRAGDGNEARLYTTSDLNGPAYVRNIPFWLGIPPIAFPGAQVRLPGGDLISAEALAEKLKRGDGTLVDAVMGIVDEKSIRRRLRGARALGHIPASVAKPKLLALLKDSNPRLRAAAVDGLSSHKSPDVVRALIDVLGEERDDDVKIAAARALVESGDRQGAAAGIAFLLKSNDPERKIAILSKLQGGALEGLADSLLPLIADTNAKVRIAALRALAGNRDSKSLGAIAARLSERGDPEVREAAARALTQSGDNTFVARGLAFDLGSSDEAKAVGAAQQLGGMSAVGREALETALRKGPEAVRVAAGNAPGGTPGRRALPALASAAEGGLAAAGTAARVLLEAQGAEALAKHINDGTPQLRLLAIEAVKDGGPASLAQAVQAANKDKDKRVRAVAAKAVARLGGEGAVAALSPLLQDEVDDVRFAAANGLGRLGSEEARAPLLGLLKYGTVKVRRAVFRALSRLKGAPPRESIAGLLDALYDDDAVVRAYAIDVLSGANKRDKRILPVVRLQLKDTNVHVRKASVRALGVLGDESIVTALEDALTDDSPEVRMVAVDALERIGGNKAAAVLEKHVATEQDKEVAARAKEAIPRAKAKQE